MAYYEQRGVRSWRLIVYGRKLPNGKKEKIPKTIVIEDDALLKTKRKLKEYLDGQLADFKREVESGLFIKPQKMLFKDFMPIWDENYASVGKNLSRGTRKTYLRHLKNHILPRFGHMQLDEIMPMHIETFVADLEKPGARKDGRGELLSSGSIEYIYRVLNNVLTRAFKWKLIPTHPMADLDKPKVKYKKFTGYGAADANKAIECLYKEPTMWRLLCLGTMFGGFRRGETLAVEWSDANFERIGFDINKSITDTENGQAIISDTKTEDSADFVDMPDWYMKMLKAYRKEWLKERMLIGTKWEGEEKEYIFHGRTGKPLYHTTPSTWWRRFCKRHDLKYIRFHDLRHTTATLLLEDGANMKDIQHRLRHSRYQTTADIYAHITKERSRATVEKFDKFDPSKMSIKKVHPQSTPN